MQAVSRRLEPARHPVMKRRARALSAILVLVSIYFVLGGSGGVLRGDVESAIRQAIVD
jgi:hypothetical protein